MKEIGNTQPPTAEPSKKKKRRRSSTHYTDKKRKRTPEDLSQSNKYLNPKLSWRLDYEIRPFLLSLIVEEADGSKAQTMVEMEELENDSIQEDSRKETNSTSVVRILRVLHIFSCLST